MKLKNILFIFILCFAVLSEIARAQEIPSGNERQRRATAPDNSEITTEQRDGVTREIRVFHDPDNPVERVEVETAADGQKKTTIYMRDGQVSELPRERKLNPLEASGKKLAAATNTVFRQVKGAASTVGDKTGDVVEKGKETGSGAIDLTKKGAKKTGAAVVAVGEKTDRVNATVVETTKEVGDKTKRAAVATASGAKAVTLKTADLGGEAVEGTVEGTKTVAHKTANLGTVAGRKTQGVGRTIVTRMKKFGRAVKEVFTP